MRSVTLRRGTRRHSCILAVLHFCIPAFLPLCIPSSAQAQATATHQYALIVSGASAGAPYAARYEGWRTALAGALRQRFNYPADHVVVLGEKEGEGVGPATREGVRGACADLAKRLTADDQLLVVLIGHGTAADADQAKFNLVGPDLSAEEWAALVAPIKARIVFVDTTAGSAPFLHRLAGRGRVVITADDSAAQRFETVFPEYFVQALQDASADTDKDGRLSIWEAFAFASDGVRMHYEGAAKLPTERAVLDDNGDGLGRDAESDGRDGELARAVYLAPQAQPASSDPELASLIAERAARQAELDKLRASKDDLAPDRYDEELEKLLVEIARLSQQIRERSR
jgi:hypothetical protein